MLKKSCSYSRHIGTSVLIFRQINPVHSGMNTKDTPTELSFNLSQHEERFQLLVDQAGDAFFILDYEGTIHDANHRACLSLGYSREELLGLNITDRESPK